MKDNRFGDLGRKRIYNKNFHDIDQEVVLWDVLDINNSEDILFRFIYTNSQYKQGVRLAIDVGEGYLEINGIQSKGMHLWEDTCLGEVKIHCESSEGKLSVYKIFNLGLTNPQGGVRSQVASCGMLVEQRNNVYVYHCNDAGFQTNFDKLVFEIEFPETEEQRE